jgi:hypothetical protein
MHRHAAWIACLLVAFVGGPADAEVTRRAASDFHRRAIVAGTITADTAYAVALSPDAVAALEKGCGSSTAPGSSFPRWCTRRPPAAK